MKIDIGKKIKDLRKSRDITQGKIAGELGWAATRFSNYEKNIRTPGIANLKIIADYFEVPLSYFINDSSPTDQKNTKQNAPVDLISQRQERAKQSAEDLMICLWHLLDEAKPDSFAAKNARALLARINTNQ
jgi:transcriptional regulator with XRE-family HTH domain